MEVIKRIKDNKLYIDLIGEFKYDDHADFKEEVLDDIATTKASAIVLCLEKLEFIDSAGLGTLLLVRDEAEQYKKKLVLLAPNGYVMKMFEVSRFVEIFDIDE